MSLASEKIEEIIEESPNSTSTRNRYQITICQDGNFAVTFDTVNLCIKIFENTDHRLFDKFNENNIDNTSSSKSDIIDKVIAHFEINSNFAIKKFYKPESNTNVKGAQETSGEDNNGFRWSFDISNLRKRGDKYFILVAVSHINVDKEMKGTKKNDTNPKYKSRYLDRKRFDTLEEHTAIDMLNPYEGTAIYYLELEKKSTESNKVIMSEGQKSEEQKEQTKESYVLSNNNNVYFFYHGVSGVCKFVDVPVVPNKPKNDAGQERFIILNFHGIYNFEFNDSNENFEKFTSFSAHESIRIYLKEKFDYPTSIRRELDSWYTDTKDNCMKRLLSCIYDKYFLVTQYKNDVQSLEVYDLAKMELETAAKRIENKDKFVKQYNYHTFSVSRLQLCFTRGVNSVLLYYMENGLQIASKEFDEVEQICLIEFINNGEQLFIIGKVQEDNLIFLVWDLYNTRKVVPAMLEDIHIEDLDSRLDRTLGNILYVNDNGNVVSVLKKIENTLGLKTEPGPYRDAMLVKNKNIEVNKHHKIYYDKNTTSNFNKYKKVISNFNKISDEIEPWVLNDYEKNSYCLYYNKKGTEIEFLQLIVGRSTVQIWHQIRDDNKKKDQLPNKGDPFLEYIWTNGIPVNQERNETRLQIEYFKYGSNDVDVNDGSNCKLNINDFSLEVYWYIRKSEKDKDGRVIKDSEIDEEIEEIQTGNLTNKTAKYVERKTMKIQRKDVIETFRSIRYACEALSHLNMRYINKSLVDNYNKVHKHEEIVTYVKHIVWRFAKYNPEQFKWLDFRHNFMKSLILGDCNHLIKFILFGVEENTDNINVSVEENENKERTKSKHIPRNTLWPGEKFIERDDLDFIMKDTSKDSKSQDDEKIMPENNMELAIYYCYYCKGRELKDTIVIAYFLEYYSRQAIDCAGWMSTVSKAIPLLFKYNYDDYVRKLFRKECFADNDHFSAQDPDGIIPEEYLERRNHKIKFRAFRPIVKLKSDQSKWYDLIFESLELLSKIYKRIEGFDNDLGKAPLALRVVPLPGFTINNIKKRNEKYNFIKIILNILWLIFIPRWYRIKRNERHMLSPFSRMVLYENNDDIYDNPATEAVIDFRWQKARNFFWLLFIRFVIYAICFGAVSWEYLNRNSDISGKFIVVLTVIFYYLAIYQLVTEVLQFWYRGAREYFEIFNIFDVISIIFSMVIMSKMIKNFQLSDGFESVTTVDTGLMVGISFSIFFLWIEFIFYLRLLSGLGIYIYYFVIIFRTIFPFFLFILIVIFAFGNTMFFLLRNPDHINTKDTTFSGSATNTLTNETLNIKLKTDFDPKSSTDNPFSNFPAAIMAAYFWIDSNWVQRNSFDFWPADAFTIIISVVLVIYLQNMLIAFMSYVFVEVETKGRQTLLRQRANHIADYEALYHIHFWRHEPEPKYIYYIGQSKNFEEWFEKRKDDQGAIYKGFEEKSTFIRRNFKNEDYDKFSISKYDNTKTEIEVKMKIEKIKDMKNDIVNRIEDLTKDLKVLKNDIEIKYINNIKNNMNANIESLIEEFENEIKKCI